MSILALAATALLLPTSLFVLAWALERKRADLDLVVIVGALGMVSMLLTTAPLAAWCMWQWCKLFLELKW